MKMMMASAAKATYIYIYMHHHRRRTVHPAGAPSHSQATLHRTSPFSLCCAVAATEHGYISEDQLQGVFWSSPQVSTQEPAVMQSEASASSDMAKASPVPVSSASQEPVEVQSRRACRSAAHRSTTDRSKVSRPCDHE